jgi:hypothetical protein
MATLQSLTRTCGQSIPPGTKTKVYFTFVSELTGFPATAEDNGGTDQGDSKMLDEAFDFSAAAARERILERIRYSRRYRISS